jgi:hypothetical protein
MDITTYENLVNKDIEFESLKWSEEFLETNDYKNFITLLKNA